MPFLLTHLPILPILLPMLAGTLLLFSSDSRHGPRLALSILALLAQFAIALLLLAGSDGRLALPWTESIGVYALGGWVAPLALSWSWTACPPSWCC